MRSGLGVESVEKAGEVAGRLYALSTAGSILGTFLPVVVLTPFIGTRRTMLATAAVLGLAASAGLGRRYVLVPAVVAAIALIPPGLVKPGNGVIWEGESSYQFIQVQKISDHGRVLHLNEGWAEHSRSGTPSAYSPAATGISSCWRLCCTGAGFARSR